MKFSTATVLFLAAFAAAAPIMDMDVEMEVEQEIGAAAPAPAPAPKATQRGGGGSSSKPTSNGVKPPSSAPTKSIPTQTSAQTKPGSTTSPKPASTTSLKNSSTPAPKSSSTQPPPKSSSATPPTTSQPKPSTTAPSSTGTKTGHPLPTMTGAVVGVIPPPTSAWSCGSGPELVEYSIVTIVASIQAAVRMQKTAIKLTGGNGVVNTWPHVVDTATEPIDLLPATEGTFEMWPMNGAGVYAVGPTENLKDRVLYKYTEGSMAATFIGLATYKDGKDGKYTMCVAK
ncbi:hypothetical protein B0J14DRAFT_564006 [Halenospora varia]|nr:hypothetical protein B0J14DRAFT_564006 [Halenospora varia]